MSTTEKKNKITLEIQKQLKKVKDGTAGKVISEDGETEVVEEEEEEEEEEDDEKEDSGGDDTGKKSKVRTDDDERTEFEQTEQDSNKV